jgi:hypothetical protein
MMIILMVWLIFHDNEDCDLVYGEPTGSIPNITAIALAAALESCSKHASSRYKWLFFGLHLKYK